MTVLLLTALGIVVGIASWLSDTEFSDADFLDTTLEDN